MIVEGLSIARMSGYADRVCLLYEDGRSVSYAELIQSVTQIASQLGDEKRLVFVEAASSKPAIAAYLACLLFGHAVLLLDPRKRDYNASLIHEFSPNTVVKCFDDDFKIQHGSRISVDLHPELAILLSTSGSTGSEKLVKISFTNIYSNTQAIVEYLGLGMADRSVTTLKMFYSYGLSVLNTHLFAGASILLTNRSTQEDRLWQLMATNDVTNFAGVPHTFHVLEQMPFDLTRLSYLRFVTQAGGRLAPDLVRRYAAIGRRQGWKLFVMYGQTEASPRISYLPPALAETNPESIGIAIPGGHLSLVDQDGVEIVASDVAGELVYSGPNVMMGYARSPADLAYKAEEGSLRTGDIATRSETGLFAIVGRKSRIVKAFGLRLSLDDMENWLGEGGIVAAVTGCNEVVHVFVAAGSDPANLRRRLSSRYSLPASLFQIRDVDCLPLLSNGKIDYSALDRLSERGTSHGQVRDGKDGRDPGIPLT